jgi:hypothetical protein
MEVARGRWGGGKKGRDEERDRAQPSGFAFALGFRIYIFEGKFQGNTRAFVSFTE